MNSANEWAIDLGRWTTEWIKEPYSLWCIFKGIWKMNSTIVGYLEDERASGKGFEPDLPRRS
jgi:hypothetical protein